MKQNIILAAAACIVLAGCATELAPVNEVAGGKQVSRISAFDAEGGSKTQLASDGKSVLWSPGDEINVYYGSSKAKFTSINDTASDISMFTSEKGIMFMGIEGSDKYIWGLYPYREDNAFDGSAVTLTVPSEQNAVAGTFAPGSFPSIGRSRTESMGFYNVCGGIMFKVSQTGIQSVTISGKNNEVIAGKVKVQFDSDGKPVVSKVVSGRKEVTVPAPSGEFKTGTSYFISLLPVTFSSGFHLRFDKGDSIAFFSTSSSVEVKRSVFAKLENKDAGLEWKPRFDLSASGTANCYIVNESRKYKFNATVKGNSAESVGTPSKAEVIWETFGTSTAPSKGDVIYDSVSLKDGYVYFSTPLVLNDGNALIAVKDSLDNILWSWHIWVCNNFNPKSSAHVYKNSVGTMMDRYLGATSATPGDVRSFGLMYQWGRKDPFLGSSALKDDRVAASTLSWPSAEDASAHLDNNTTLSYSVSHPTTFLKNIADPYNWYCTKSKYKNDGLWMAVKTKFDPCPPGWRVPEVDVIPVALDSTYYDNSGPWDKTNLGMNFGSGNGHAAYHQLGSATTIWYPGVGYRNESGKLNSCGYTGFCWTCDFRSDKAYCLFYGSDRRFWAAQYVNRVVAQAVRCLLDSKK